MSKTLIGMVTFGNVNFSRLTIKSIKETTKHKIDFFVVVGKPGDETTKEMLREENISFIEHEENRGFPISVNDIYDYCWKEHDYDNLILVGNDIIVYPYCIDSMIELADTAEYQVISALQYDVKSLVQEHPETRVYFDGEKMIFSSFSSTPWDKFFSYSDQLNIADMQLYDIQNCCLYKREMFDALGYVDVNFYPAYYVDNDYARRIVFSGIKCCSLTNARFFHFWSRTIHQERGGSSHHQFDNNRKYYITKWGGDFGRETYKLPFVNRPLKISSREKEDAIINFWRTN